jgi:hypothetical protein
MMMMMMMMTTMMMMMMMMMIMMIMMMMMMVIGDDDCSRSYGHNQAHEHELGHACERQQSVVVVVVVVPWWVAARLRQAHTPRFSQRDQNSARRGFMSHDKCKSAIVKYWENKLLSWYCTISEY